MAKLVPEFADIERLKKIVVDYLQGESLRIIQDRLTLETEEFNKSCLTLFKSIPLTDKAALKDDAFVIAILGSLNINKNPDGSFDRTTREILKKSDNLYELLANLHHSGQSHLRFLLNRIENTHPQGTWAAFFISGALASVGVGGIFYFKQDYLNAFLNWLDRVIPVAYRWTMAFFKNLRNIPLLSIIVNGIVLAWQWYCTFAYGASTTPMYKITRLVFKTLNSALLISANLLSYFAQGALTAPGAIFFILASAIDVLESLYVLSVLYTTSPKKLPKRTTWGERAELIRDEHQNLRLYKALWVKLAAAILITGSVILCCTLPSNLVLSVSCLVFSWFITFAKNSIISQIYHHAAKELQRDLKNIKTTKNSNLTPTLSPEEKKLAEDKKKLEREKAKVSKDKAKLTKSKERFELRKSTIKQVLEALKERENSPKKLLGMIPSDSDYSSSDDETSSRSHNSERSYQLSTSSHESDDSSKRPVFSN